MNRDKSKPINNTIKVVGDPLGHEERLALTREIAARHHYGFDEAAMRRIAPVEDAVVANLGQFRPELEVQRQIRGQYGFFDFLRDDFVGVLRQVAVNLAVIQYGHGHAKVVIFQERLVVKLCQVVVDQLQEIVGESSVVQIVAQRRYYQRFQLKITRSLLLFFSRLLILR